MAIALLQSVTVAWRDFLIEVAILRSRLLSIQPLTCLLDDTFSITVRARCRIRLARRLRPAASKSDNNLSRRVPCLASLG